MRTLLSTLALLLALGLFLPSALRAEDGEPAEPPTADTPQEPAPDAPKEDEPGGKKGGDDGKNGDDPILHDVPEEKPAEEQPKVPAKIYRKRSVTVTEAPPPAGMVRVPGGMAVVGTPYQALAKLLIGRAKNVKAKFMFEGPEHRVPMPAFYIDRYEVTNQQYYVFLQSTALATYHTDKGTYANVEEVAGALLGLPQDQWHEEELFWRQLYEANKAKLHGTMPDLVVMQGDQVDEERTAGKFRHAPLKRGIELGFYSRRPPKNWRGIQPPKDQQDHPVTTVSYNDAEAFAEWAGKHIPTEQEWEYAGRGPEGFLFPWGDEWFRDASHANWGGKIVKDYIAVTVPVYGDLKPVGHSLERGDEPWSYDGMSWCGAWHMLGNVAEWTSSWFDRYPNNERMHGHMGEYVKIIRGASMEDVSPLVLRLSARNFIGLGPKGPPIPLNRFKNVGFRCAWYGNPGQDKLGPVLRRTYRDRRVKKADVALKRWTGAAATKWATPGSVPEGYVFVEGQSHAIVLVPLLSILKPGQKKPKLKNRKDLLKASVGEDPVPLAILHTDVGLDKVYVRDLEAIKKARDDKKAGKRGRRRRKPKAPLTKKGTVPAGTYLLAFWHERLCLTQPSLELVCFLSKDTIPDRNFVVKPKVKPEDMPPTTLEVTDVADIFELGFSIPIGGAAAKKGVGPTIFVDHITIDTVKGQLEGAGTWKSGQYVEPTGIEAAAPAEPEKVPEKVPEEAPAKAPETAPEETPEKSADDTPAKDPGADETKPDGQAEKDAGAGEPEPEDEDTPKKGAPKEE